MPLKVNLGISKKMGQPNYGSLGASCHVEFELDGNLLRDNPERFHQHVNSNYIACRRAVLEELARHQNSPTLGEHQESQLSATGAGRPSVSSRREMINGNGASEKQASEKQLSYIDQLARQIDGLGVHKLDRMSNHLFGIPVSELSSLQASLLIDSLKAIKEGRLSLAAALNGAIP